MLNKLDKNKCNAALELAVYGMEDAVKEIAYCRQNPAVILENFNISRGVYIATMDFLRDGYEEIYDEMYAKYNDRYYKAWNSYGNFFHKIYCTMI